MNDLIAKVEKGENLPSLLDLRKMAKVELDKEKKEEIWTARTWYETKAIVEETDFEETRRCLLNSYHNYFQNHVYYMIAIMIGFVGLFASNEFLFKIIYGTIFIFIAALVLVSYDFLRIKYWTYYASIAMILTKNQAIKLFNDYKSKMKCFCLKDVPASSTCILTIAIKCQLCNITNDKNGYWLSRYAMKIVLKTEG